MIDDAAPIRDARDAMLRIPRYARLAVEAMRALDGTVSWLCRRSWLPFRIVTRSQLAALRKQSDEALTAAALVGTAARIVAVQAGVANGWDEEQR